MSGPDDATKATVQKLPLLTVKAGPRDGDDWIARVKEEYMALIQVRTAHETYRKFAHRRTPRSRDVRIFRWRDCCLLAQYQKVNKEQGNEWFTIESNSTGTRWTGKVWHMHEMKKYEFDLEFEVPVAYPQTAPELALPELDGKTEKMYRGGKICLDSHFRPLWARNVPHFGIAHAMALGVRTSRTRTCHGYATAMLPPPHCAASLCLLTVPSHCAFLPRCHRVCVARARLADGPVAGCGDSGPHSQGPHQARG